MILTGGMQDNEKSKGGYCGVKGIYIYIKEAKRKAKMKR